MRKGFTLIELMLYVGAAALLLLACSMLLALMLSQRVKNRTIREVNDQSYLALRFITRTIRNSASLNFPREGEVSGELVLNMPGAEDPTRIRAQGGVLYVSEGGAPEVQLTSSRLIVTELLFANYGPLGTPGGVQVIFSARHANPEGRNEFDYRGDFRATATLNNPS